MSKLNWQKVRHEDVERRHGVKNVNGQMGEKAWIKTQTKGEAKMRLVDKGIGCWTLHQGEWCVRIAGSFKAGDRVRVMANNGNIADAVLGDVVPNTRFQWRNSAGDRVDGQLFRRWRLKAGAA